MASDSNTSPHATTPSGAGLEIALALSGGGIRAAVFHLGVLQRLAADRLLEQVRFLSTVSGGSLVVGLIYGLNDGMWPSSDRYLAHALPAARERLTTKDLQRTYIRRCITRPWRLFRGRAHVLSSAVQDLWGISGMVRDIPPEPRWIINATTYETGKNWRFMPQRMGDYQINHVLSPGIPTADAVSASAAFPGGIGPLVLKKSDFSWTTYAANGRCRAEPLYPEHDRIHLWDGGVYDNLGVEPLFKPGHRFREGFNFLIVSDASMALEYETRRTFFRRGLRLIDIATSQVRGLRARMLIDHFRDRSNTGAYLTIRHTVPELRARAVKEGYSLPGQLFDTLGEASARAAAGMRTSLRQLSTAEANNLIRHGWEVADATLAIYHPSLFQCRSWPGVQSRE